MANFSAHVVPTLISDKTFQMLLTIVAIFGLLIASALKLEPTIVDTFKTFSIASFGYWLGLMGSGLQLANRVEEATTKKVEAQLVRSERKNG